MNMPNTELEGTLEIDHARGVIYFHLKNEADALTEIVFFAPKVLTNTDFMCCRTTS